MKKNKFLLALTISFLLVGLGGLAGIVQGPSTYFLGTKVALADEYCDWVDNYVATPEQQAVLDADNWVDNYVATPEQQAVLDADNWVDNYVATPEQTQALNSSQSQEAMRQGMTDVGMPNAATDTGRTIYTDNGQNYIVDYNGNPQPVTLDKDGTTIRDSQGQVIDYMKAADSTGAGQSVNVNGQTYSNPNLTSPTGENLYRGQDQNLYSYSNGQMNPYSGSTVQGGAGSEEQNGISEVKTIDGQNVMDDQGRRVMENAQGQNGFIDSNGKFTLYDYSNGNQFWNEQTGKQMAATPDGKNFYNVEFDSSGKAYIMGEDGKTKWTYDDKGNLTGVNEKGDKFTLDANGNAVSASGGSAAAGIAPNIVRSLTAGGGYAGSGGGLFGALGSAVGSVIGGVGSAISGALGLGGSTGTYYGTTGYGGGTSGYYGTSGGSSTGGYSSLGSLGGYSSGTSIGGWNPARYASTGLPAASIYSIVQNIVMWALSLFGFFGIIGFVISGVWYLLAAGDDALMKRAKNGMLYSIIGVVVGLIGLVIIYAANAMLNGSWFF